VALQPDGKIVMAGLILTGTYEDFLVLRYNVDGSPDTSFGTGGAVTTPIGSYGSEAYAVAIQSDGKIVVAGHTFFSYPNYDDFSLVRYNTDGSLDVSFGSGGKVTTAIGPTNDRGYDVAIQPDGKLLVVGYCDTGGVAWCGINADGSLDASFGAGGRVVSGIGDGARGVALQSDGRIVVVG